MGLERRRLQKQAFVPNSIKGFIDIQWDQVSLSVIIASDNKELNFQTLKFEISFREVRMWESGAGGRSMDKGKRTRCREEREEWSSAIELTKLLPKMLFPILHPYPTLLTVIFWQLTSEGFVSLNVYGIRRNGFYLSGWRRGCVSFLRLTWLGVQRGSYRGVYWFFDLLPVFGRIPGILLR